MSGLTSVGAIIGCRHGDAFLARKIAENGAVQVGFYCRECRRWVTREKGGRGVWLPHDDALLGDADLETLPIVETWMTFRRCEGPCGRTLQCEEHHVAPRVIFGADADRWPLVYLCRECHMRWHALVTWYVPAFFRLAEAVAVLQCVASLPTLKSMFRRIVDAMTGDQAA
jgi:hypothetical protein